MPVLANVSIAVGAVGLGLAVPGIVFLAAGGSADATSAEASLGPGSAYICGSI